MIDEAALVPTYGGPRSNTIDDVAEFLRLRIQEGAFLLGDQIPPERDLALALGVARTTVSGAFNRLQAEGYVERRRGGRGGTYVTDLVKTAEAWCRKMAVDIQGFRDMYEYRLALETYAAGLAAQRRLLKDLAKMRGALAMLEMLQLPGDDVSEPTFDWRSRIRGTDFEFHSSIAKACQSRVLARAVLDARAMLFTGFLVTHWEETRSCSQVMSTAADHKTILTAIVDGRTEKAKQAMEKHLLDSRQRMEEILQEYRNPTVALPGISIGTAGGLGPE
jgi:GntR family transcriptional regulator, transcriptional repressor for pyruvate dehydrogenase complex